MSLEELKDKQDKQRKASRDLLLILLLLPLGICMMCVAGQAAIKLAPTWQVEADMGSRLDPNVDYALKSNQEYLEPILPGILDDPAWIDVFLTPGAYIPRGENQQTVDNPSQESSPSTQVPTESQDTIVPEENLQPTQGSGTVVVMPPPTQPPSNPKPPAPPNPPEPTSEPPSDVQVNLKTTNTNGQSTYTPGSTVVYSIVVTNTSTNDIVGAIIKDDKPVQVVSWNWVCKTVTKASGCDAVAGSISNFTDTVNIQAGGSIQYEVTASIDGGATGDLVNEVILSVPSGYADTDLSDNSATDTDTLSVVVLPTADLVITKTDEGGGTYTPGAGITYTIGVTNSGPGNASGFNITDNVPTVITNVSIDSCNVTGNGDCGNGNIVGNVVTFTGASINPGAGNKITIQLSGTVPLGTTGAISNRVDIVIPGGVSFTDPVTSNNYKIHDITQSTLPSADLAITKTDGSGGTYASGVGITYTIEVNNNIGPDDASGFNITDTMPSVLTNLKIDSCNVTGTASCGTGSISGNLVTFTGASINAGSSNKITIKLSGIVPSGTTGTISNKADIVIPGGASFTDPVDTNNHATFDSTQGLPPLSYCTGRYSDVSDLGSGLSVSVDVPSGDFTCIRFTSASLAQGASITMSGHPDMKVWWYGTDQNLAGSCSNRSYVYPNAGVSLTDIGVARNGDIIVYVLNGSSGNSTVDISSITNWSNVCQ